MCRRLRTSDQPTQVTASAALARVVRKPLAGDDALGCAARRALDDLRVPLRELLKKRVSDLYVESSQEPA